MDNELKTALHCGICEIDFIKVDGSRRLMKCTNNIPIIDRHEVVREKTTARTRPANENLLVVFDLEKNDWRSIRIDTIIGWKFL
jgi:hypothetical protein